MLRILRKIIEILDGTPAVYGKKQRGQSMVELALVSPLLIFVLAGMVEIGWFARNYMILLEVTRVGGRTGAVQQNELGPLAWDDNGSIVPSRLGDRSFADVFPDFTTANDWATVYRQCTVQEGVYIGFYNFLACIMQRSLDPLLFGTADRIAAGDMHEGQTAPDDIVISAFAIQTVDPAEIPNTGAWAAIRSDIAWPLGEAAGPQGIVVGRWPDNANECHYDQGGAPYDAGNPGGNGVDGRDPFDWIQEGARTLNPTYSSLPADQLEDRHYLELEEPDSGTREEQRGFSWFGTHQIEGTGCYGSEWNISDVENLINLQHFNLDTTQRAYVPSQGLILVEMWWQHKSLSQFVGLAPVISPVFAMLGEDTIINVWAAFPLPQVEPRIDFSH